MGAQERSARCDIVGGRTVRVPKELSKDRALQAVDLLFIHALGATGANRFIEAVAERPVAVQGCCW